MKTPEQIKREFRANGITVTAWAKKHGVKTNAVWRVLKGSSKCYYGDGHKIAVLLGLKNGSISEVEK